MAIAMLAGRSRDVSVFGARRPMRVVVLLAGVVVLSLADLAITIAHLRGVGMIEVNPIAAYLIKTTGSSWALAAYKCATLAVCVALLYRARRHVIGEMACWLALAILAGLSVVWDSYTKTDRGSQHDPPGAGGHTWRSVALPALTTIRRTPKPPGTVRA